MAAGWIFKGQVFYHGGWTLELNLQGREGEDTQYCLWLRRERLVNFWHIFKSQQNHQGGNKSTKTKPNREEESERVNMEISNAFFEAETVLLKKPKHPFLLPQTHRGSKLQTLAQKHS